eukprot:gene35019-42408_t
MSLLYLYLRILLLIVSIVLMATGQDRVWTRLVSASGRDEGKGLAVHPTTGDVYATGYAQGALHGQPHVGSSDIILMKYASNGTRVWTRMEGTSARDEGRGLAVHPSSGDVYMTGYAAGSNDIILMKYASNGTRVWTRMEGTSGNDLGFGVSVHPSSGDVMEGTSGNDEGWGVAVHPNTGDVYVTGYTQAALHGQPHVGSSDIILMKYASNGTRVWTRMVGTSGNDVGYGVAVHPSSGDVYVTGFAGGALHGQLYVASSDIILIKYASNGTRVWTRLEGTSSGDEGYGVAVHPSSGDVYATGYAQGALHGQPHVVSSDIILMNSGDVYVTGFAGGALHGQLYVASSDIILIKYASNGTRVWTRLEGTSSGDEGYGVAVHPSSGDVYATGYAQ